MQVCKPSETGYNFCPVWVDHCGIVLTTSNETWTCSKNQLLTQIHLGKRINLVSQNSDFSCDFSRVLGSVNQWLLWGACAIVFIKFSMFWKVSFLLLSFLRNLSNNRITTLEAGCLDNLSSSLMVIKLNRNRISMIPPKIFRLPHVQFL